MKNPQLEPPEKKKKLSFSSLPDDIAVNCLARIPRPYYPRLSIVSKNFRSLLSSSELYAARCQFGTTEQCLYVCLRDRVSQILQWFTLWINPNQTLPDSSMVKKRKNIRQLLVPIPPSNFSSGSKSIVAVGYEIYVIGGSVDGVPSSAVRILNCRTHTWRDAPSMNVGRENASLSFYDGKIYVIGGCTKTDDVTWAEVFDTKTRTWEWLSDPGIRKLWNVPFPAQELEGKIYFRPADKSYAYTKQGKWELCESFRLSQCCMENVSYTSYGYNIWWYDIKVKVWKKVKGLDSLQYKLLDKGGSITSMLVTCGGKLLLVCEIIEPYLTSKKICCAEFVLEKRDGGEVWGTIVWVDVVHTIPTTSDLLHCGVVSV